MVLHPRRGAISPTSGAEGPVGATLTSRPRPGLRRPSLTLHAPRPDSATRRASWGVGTLPLLRLDASAPTDSSASLGGRIGAGAHRPRRPALTQVLSRCSNRGRVPPGPRRLPRCPTLRVATGAHLGARGGRAGEARPDGSGVEAGRPGRTRAPDPTPGPLLGRGSPCPTYRHLTPHTLYKYTGGHVAVRGPGRLLFPHPDAPVLTHTLCLTTTTLGTDVRGVVAESVGRPFHDTRGKTQKRPWTPFPPTPGVSTSVEDTPEGLGRGGTWSPGRPTSSFMDPRPQSLPFRLLRTHSTWTGPGRTGTDGPPRPKDPDYCLPHPDPNRSEDGYGVHRLETEKGSVRPGPSTASQSPRRPTCDRQWKRRPKGVPSTKTPRGQSLGSSRYPALKDLHTGSYRCRLLPPSLSGGNSRGPETWFDFGRGTRSDGTGFTGPGEG